MNIISAKLEDWTNMYAVTRIMCIPYLKYFNATFKINNSFI